MMEPEVQTADAPEAANASDPPSQAAESGTPDAPEAGESGAPGGPKAAESGAPDGALLEADLLVEDVSIDGMCGVY